MRHIVGIFSSVDAAIKAIDVYELRGHHSRNITIFTNEEKAKLLANRTRLPIKTNIPKKETAKKGFFKRLLNKTDDFQLDTHDKLIQFGLSEADAKKSMKDVEQGEIVVLAKNERKMGHG